ncbi:hypothetical protein B9479_006271 [Cryptococcus floricola]|uniref:Pinin/SDK/MemA protein domain-containing protein n=1 Tax=Cryptococcus floricola TaxID=2591691 RepID=A0A5D3ASR9_9TREE|nr:hypothetical protein B9479_006271 [Cryptococcus floricola]
MPEQSPERLSPSTEATHDRPEPEHTEAPPTKRARPNRDDKARGKRLFGNILGTLQKFQTEDKSTRGSEAARKREEVSERIAKKLHQETALNHEITETDRELKGLKIASEHAEATLRQKDISIGARHSLLQSTAKFLHTRLPLPHPPVFEGGLFNPAPLPISVGPKREPPIKTDLPPLYFLPKILLPHQQGTIASQTTNLSERISEEQASLETERQHVRTLVKENRVRIEELSEKLGGLRRQVRPERADERITERDRGHMRSERSADQREPRRARGGDRGVGVDELGRARREDMMDVDQDKEEGDKAVDLRDEREKGVKIQGDDGDIEVEY